MAILDVRRTDLRGSIFSSPYWITSGDLVPAADDAEAVLFSFPAAKYGAIVQMHEAMVEVIDVFDGTSVDALIGNGTMPLETTTTGGTCTGTDPNSLFETGDVDLTAAGYTYVSGGTFFTAQAAFTRADGVSLITPADSAVPVIFVSLTASTAITTGKARLHLLISNLPI